MAWCPDDEGDYRLGLALDLERRHRLSLEGVAGAHEHGLGREHLARLGVAHDARGQVHGVAGDREDAPVSRPEVVREDEHPAGVHAHAQPDRRARRVSGDDVVHGAQQALCVVRRGAPAPRRRG